MAIGAPKEFDTRNKDLEDLEELNPPLPKAIKKKPMLDSMTGEEEDQEDGEEEKKVSSLQDFIEIIIKIGK